MECPHEQHVSDPSWSGENLIATNSRSQLDKKQWKQCSGTQVNVYNITGIHNSLASNVHMLVDHSNANIHNDWIDTFKIIKTETHKSRIGTLPLTKKEVQLPFFHAMERQSVKKPTKDSDKTELLWKGVRRYVVIQDPGAHFWELLGSSAHQHSGAQWKGRCPRGHHKLPAPNT